MSLTIRRVKTFREALERGRDDPVAFAHDFLDLDVHPGQAKWLRTRNDAKERMLHCSNRWGKALALDTPIPIPTGWTTMGDLEVGSWVYDSQGQLCRVRAVTDVQYGRECFDVAFSDGSVITADADHQWVTWTAAARRGEERRQRRGWQPKHQPSVVTTRQIAETLKIGRLTNHSVSVAEAITPGVTWVLPVDPYALGVWLGDGHTDSGAITSADPEVPDQLRIAGYDVVPRKSPLTFGVRCLSTGLRVIGVLGNKHVPTPYLRASIEQRLALLQGLMDTDGSVQEGGHCEFLVTKERLARDAFELVASLGLKPTWAEERATLNGRDCGPRYRVSFTTDLPVFRLPRKLEVLRTAKLGPTTKHRYIVAVRPRPSVPVKCIEVDSPDSTYLAGRAFIPTHNSFVSGIKLLHRGFYLIRDQEKAFDTRGRLKPYVAINVAMSMDQAKLAWDYAVALGSASPRFAKFITNIDYSPFPCLSISNGAKGPEAIVSEVWARSTAKKAKYLLGKHFAYVNYDEAAFDADGEDIFNDVIRMRLADEAGDIDFTSTPNLKNWFFAQCEQGRLREPGLDIHDPRSYVNPRCYTQTGVIFDNPHVKHEFVRETMKYMTEVQKQQNVYGEFADAANIFSVSHVQACQRDQDYRDLMGNEGIPADYDIVYVESPAQGGRYAKLRRSDSVGEYVIGADLARKRDKTVIIVLRVDVEPAQMVLYKAFSRTSWKFVYEEIQRAHLKYHSAPILIDSTGVGDNVLSALQEEPYNLPAHGYNFAGTGKEKINLVIHLQEAIQNGRIAFPHIRELYEQLVYYDWEDKKLDTDSLFSLALAWECNLRVRGLGVFDPGSMDFLVASSYTDYFTGKRSTSLDRTERVLIPEEELERLRRLAEEDRIRRYNDGEDLEPAEYGLVIPRQSGWG